MSPVDPVSVWNRIDHFYLDENMLSRKSFVSLLQLTGEVYKI
jgi:hypothetical protein